MRAYGQAMEISTKLDLPDNKTGTDKYGRKVCVVLLANSDGTAGAIFNRMLVDAGHAKVEDAKDNEFDPAEWWPSAPDKVNDKKYVGSTKSNNITIRNAAGRKRSALIMRYGFQTVKSLTLFIALSNSKSLIIMAIRSRR